ncbi:MAG: sulfur carrier protein ThiS adenylyltransferase ThiF [Tissierellales bacterium]|nr:sulfur carrier protein ThiS adenylyltransferase ThiF [Tissierellales bacterium]
MNEHIKSEFEKALIERHGEDIHRKLQSASVGIAGLGGLGSNVAVSLVRLGIGKLVLVDFDLVDQTNLNRQYYFRRNIGQKKTDALKEILEDISPITQIETKNVYLDDENSSEMFKDTNLIVEAMDKAESKVSFVQSILTKCKDKKLVSASGMAGALSSNTIRTRKINERFSVVGDEVSHIDEFGGLMAPRVAIAANHQANQILRWILNIEKY